MLNELIYIQRIRTEQLKSCFFQKSAGDGIDANVSDHGRKLGLAILLRSNIQSYVKIVFNTSNGYKELQSKIWGTTDKHIMLKCGGLIPVDAVAYITTIPLQVLPELS